MTFYTAIATVAAAASAIIAWAARSDSLRAEGKADKAREEATQAEQRATEIATEAASALSKANKLAERHFDERLKLERRRDRAQWGMLLRGWASSRALRASLPEGARYPQSVRKVQIAVVSDARFGLDEPTAVILQGRVHSIIKSFEGELDALSGEERADKLMGFPLVVVAVEDMIEAWIADPSNLPDVSPHDSEPAAP